MSNHRVSTWSGIQNKLEHDYLCPALRGHIQYFATSYSKSADHEGRAAIRVDGVEVLRSNYYTYFENVWTRFHHLRSTTLKDSDSAKEAINQAHAFALDQGTFDQKVFYQAFGIFDNQSIEKSLVSENPLVRIFALLDRRLGKRRLLALEESMERELPWVRAFYVIRMQAEGLMEANNIQEGTTMSQIASFYLLKDGQRQELSNGDCSGAVYTAIWDWCKYELDLDVRFPAPQTEDTLDCALLEGELAADLLSALRERNLPELAAEIAPDWDLPAETIQSGLETLRSHLELVQGNTSLLYEMT